MVNPVNTQGHVAILLLAALIKKVHRAALLTNGRCTRSKAQCMGMMEGHWKLVYTTNTQTLMMLNAIDALPLVDIGNVYQIIDAESMTASNKCTALRCSGFPLFPCQAFLYVPSKRVEGIARGLHPGFLADQAPQGANLPV
eukprot:1158253-Pelagomonas_calceolata.AAC.7